MGLMIIQRFSYCTGFAVLALMGCSPAQQSPALPIEIAPQNTAYFGPTFETVLDTAKARLDENLKIAPIIPTPKDAGGGYTHEKHKDNAKLIYDAGMVYALTGETKYAELAASVMRAYADVYPTWGTHPAKKEQSPGRMFWQNLNESWWLVHVAQSYGAIKDTLSEDDRDYIESNLLRNIADFLSTGSPETFDKIHNHGTWATAAVGLTGYALGDLEYVEQALLGLDKSGEAGFLKQLDLLFSPDGYYNEGPYYQRYALMPFVLFAQAVDKNQPDRAIFSYRDGILQRAIYATIHLNYNGLFFPINDAIKDKSIATTELLYGVSIAYDLTQDPGLLSIAKAQGDFVLTPESRAVSRAIVNGEAEPFDYRSMRLRDGASGDQGALDILRGSSDPKGLTVLVKNTSQGLGHGHFDKLNILFFDQGHEVLRDYGAARFLNVEPKFGGHYLFENNAYAKQTVAHNTLVVDETSHFGGVTDTGNQNAPDTGIFIDTPTYTVTSATIDTAYDGVTLSRHVAMIKDAAFEHPILVDVVSGSSDDAHKYDLPFHFNGHLIHTNFEVEAYTSQREPVGKANGYEYLWETALADVPDSLAQVSWILDRRFYTVSTLTPAQTDIIFFETGANDPNFNLRREPGYMLRSASIPSVTYISIIEAHGEYNPTAEFTREPYSRVSNVSYDVRHGYSVVGIETERGDDVKLIIADDQDSARSHTISVGSDSYEWTGPYFVSHSK